MKDGSVLDREGLVNWSGGYLTDGEKFELIAWSCYIVGCCNN